MLFISKRSFIGINITLWLEAVVLICSSVSIKEIALIRCYCKFLVEKSSLLYY